MDDKMRAGRNDPCPCGSGRKYKRCCLERGAATDLQRHRLRRAEGEVLGNVLRFAATRYGGATLDAAWSDFAFTDEPESPPVDAPEFETLFVPWVVFNWVPDPECWTLLPDDAPVQPLAVEYLAAHGAEIDALQMDIIRAAAARPFSFYAVTGVVPGRSLALQDILTQRTVEVLEQQGSRAMQRGAILYGRVVSVDGASILSGCAPLLIPPSYHGRLIDIRESLATAGEPVTERALHACDEELRNEYFDIADALYNPRLPELRNTDGDPLVPTTLSFDLRCTPGEAFEALKPLALGEADHVLEHDAAFASDGALAAVRFKWLQQGNTLHKSWDTTVVASLAIDGPSLTADVNSERRAELLRAEVGQRLGERAVFKRAVMQNVEKALEAARNRPESAAARRRREESEHLAALPEVREQLAAMMAAHWESWLDTPIPALRNQTPLAAARTPVGRERLEALLRDFEWHGERMDDPLLVPDVAALRSKLGLPAEQ